MFAPCCEGGLSPSTEISRCRRAVTTGRCLFLAGTLLVAPADLNCAILLAVAWRCSISVGLDVSFCF